MNTHISMKRALLVTGSSLFLAMTASLPAAAQADNTPSTAQETQQKTTETKPSSSPNKQDKKNEKFLDIKAVKSPEGLTAWLVEDHSVPVIALQFSFRNAGAKTDPKNKQGLARLASNTMDEGAGDIGSLDFQKRLRDLSITLRFNVGRDHFGGVLKTLTKNKNEAFDLLELALTEPRFDEEPVNRMRASNISRIKNSMSNPQWIAARIKNHVIFEGHPYAMNSGGTLSTLENITPQDLHNFHQGLGKNQLVIAAAGDITPQELSVLLDDLFGDLPVVKTSETKTISLKNTGKTYLYKKDIPQTIISMSQEGIDRTDDDYYPAQMMNFILGESGFGSRLMEEIREKRGLTYGVYSYYSDYEEADVLNVSTSTANENVSEMTGLIKDEWKKIQEKPVSENELADAKSYLIGSMPLSLTSTDSIASILLSLQMDNLPLDYLDHHKDRMNAITAQDIQKTAQRLLDAQKLTTIMVGDPKNIDNPIIVDKLPNVE